MSVAPVPPGYDIEATRQPQLYAASLITYALAVVALSLRLLSRRLLKSGFWLDDWFTIAALLTATGFLVSTIVWIHQGLGKHYESLHFDFVTSFFKNLFAGEILYCLTISFVKFSILCFCWRIFSSSVSIRRPIYVLGGIVAMWTIAVLLVTIFQCDPVSGFWNRAKPAKCRVGVHDFFLGNAIPNILTDVALLALPLPYVWRLNRSRSQKIALAGVFLLGGFVIVVSIVRLVILLDLDLKSKDLDYNFAPFGVWTRTEANIAIVCACLPSCRPILSFVLTGSLNPTRQSGHASGKGPALSWPLKQRPSAGASKKGSDTSYVDNDDRHLIARPKKDRGLPWTEAQSSRTIVTGPILERSKPWDSQGNAAPCLSGRWLSDKQTWDEAAFRSGDDVEMQRPNKAASDGINVKNDFTIQWTSSQQ